MGPAHRGSVFSCAIPCRLGAKSIFQLRASARRAREIPGQRGTPRVNVLRCQRPRHEQARRAPAIQVVDYHKTYRDLTAVAGLTFEVPRRGRFLAWSVRTGRARRRRYGPLPESFHRPAAGCRSRGTTSLLSPWRQSGAWPTCRTTPNCSSRSPFGSIWRSSPRPTGSTTSAEGRTVSRSVRIGGEARTRLPEELSRGNAPESGRRLCVPARTAGHSF